ncbi:MAG: hypothetical protein R3C56_25205 [Pirellulaceae bacterium]
MGEFGGHGLPVQGHLWDANRRNWGYGSLPKDEAEYKQRYGGIARHAQQSASSRNSGWGLHRPPMWKVRSMD